MEYTQWLVRGIQVHSSFGQDSPGGTDGELPLAQAFILGAVTQSVARAVVEQAVGLGQDPLLDRIYRGFVQGDLLAVVEVCVDRVPDQAVLPSLVENRRPRVEGKGFLIDTDYGLS